ncbi:MAG: ABC transporter permease [Bacteroidales bacterium]|nr:ABC transporter permease [Bacteroidales bacterium]
MILHYIKIAIRNLKKYKVQTAISVISMAVGVTLMAVIHSMLLVVLEVSSLERNPDYNQIHWVQGTVCRQPVFLQKLENREFKSIRDYCPLPDHTFTMEVYLEDNEEQEKYVRGRVLSVPQKTFDFYHFISPITGEPLKKLEDNTVIVTENFAMQTYGTLDVVGRQVRLWDYTQKWNEQEGRYDIIPNEWKSFVISDVLHTNMSDNFHNADIYKKQDDYLCQTYKILLIPNEGCQYQQLCDDILPLAEELLGAEHGTSIGYLPWSYHSYENGDDWQPDMYHTIKAICYTVVGLILLAAFLGYIRMQTQLFWIRQREIALRTVVGGQMKSLFGLFFTEIGLVMLMTLGTSLLICHIMRELLYESVTIGLRTGGMLWQMNDFEQYAAVVIVALTIVSMLFVMLVVWQIRQSQTGLALQMKPQRSHAMRRIAIGFQMILSTIFIAVSLMLYDAVLDRITKGQEGYNVEKYRESFVCSITSGENNFYDKMERLKKMDNIEGIVPWYRSNSNYNPEEEIEELKYYFIYTQKDDELVKYLDIEITPVPCSASKENTVYVSEKMYDAITKGGTQAAPAIRMFSLYDYETNQFLEPEYAYVAGTFKSIPSERTSMQTVIWNRPYNTATYLVSAKKGETENVRKALTELRDEGLASVPKDPVQQVKKANDTGEEMLFTVVYTIFILTVINIISTCSSLYSAISLDVRRRKKEVQLRKINGALARDIFKIFSKEYMILLIVCFVAALPLSYIAGIVGSQELNISQSNFEDVIWMFIWNYMKVAGLITIITVLTVGGKIWGIMHVKPVEALKE